MSKNGSTEKEPLVLINGMCGKHQSLLIHQAEYSEDEPWRALVVAAQIALLQMVSCLPEVHAAMEGDIHGISKLGCLACYRPDFFGEVVEVAKTREPGRLKELGESYVFKFNAAQIREKP